MSWTGKPVPANVNLKAGFKINVKPTEIVAARGRGAMFPFTREFYHPEDQIGGVSATAISRFRMDGRRFPPGAYEEHCLLWKGPEFRQPDPDERAQIMGWPVGLTDEVDNMLSTSSRARRQAALNSFIGNGLHLPCIMMAFVMLLQTAGGCNISYHLPYDPQEKALRDQVAGTVWQPGFVESFPGVLSAEQIWQDVRLVFEDHKFDRLPWRTVQELFVQQDVAFLQCYWVYAVMAGSDPLEQGQEWLAQRL